MEFPVTIDTQDAFDQLVKERLGREKTKVDEATARADAAEAAKATAEQERDAAQTRATELETQVTTLGAQVQGFESEKQINQLRADIAKTAGVPAAILRGSTKEELEAHAAELKPLLTAQEAPVIPNQGDSPTNPAATDSEERAAARALFGSSDD